MISEGGLRLSEVQGEAYAALLDQRSRIYAWLLYPLASTKDRQVVNGTYCLLNVQSISRFPNV